MIFTNRKIECTSDSLYFLCLLINYRSTEVYDDDDDPSEVEIINPNKVSLLTLFILIIIFTFGFCKGKSM